MLTQPECLLRKPVMRCPHRNASRHDRFRKLSKIITQRVAILSLLFLPTGAVNAAPKLGIDARKRVFMQVWMRVRDNFYDPGLNGVKWDAIRRRYAPRIDRATSDESFYAALNEMLAELKASYLAVIPPDAYAPEAAANSKSAEGETGLTAQLVDGHAVITRIEPDSSAERAGLRPGFVITHVGGKPVDMMIGRIKRRKLRPGMERLYVMVGLNHMLNGALDSTVKVRVIDGADMAKEVALTRGKHDGQLVQFAELPPLYAHVETKVLTDNIGYIRFNIFLLPVLQRIKQAIRDMHSAPGIILDLRGNPGGVGAMASSIADELYGSQSTLGAMKLRQGEIRFAIFPVTDPYRGVFVLLID